MIVSVESREAVFRFDGVLDGAGRANDVARFKGAVGVFEMCLGCGGWQSRWFPPSVQGSNVLVALFLMYCSIVDGLTILEGMIYGFHPYPHW